MQRSEIEPMPNAAQPSESFTGIKALAGEKHSKIRGVSPLFYFDQGSAQARLTNSTATTFMIYSKKLGQQASTSEEQCLIDEQLTKLPRILNTQVLARCEE